MEDKLRIGLMLDSLEVPAWQEKSISDVCQSKHADIVVVILNADSNGREPKPRQHNIQSEKRRLVHRALRKALDALYKLLIDRHRDLPDAHRRINVGPLLHQCPLLEVQPQTNRASHDISSRDVEKIQLYAPDVLLCFGFRTLRGQILSCARLGLWTLHHGDNRVNRGGPAGFWESMQSWPEIGSILKIATEDPDSDQILYRSYSCTNPMSIPDTRSAAYWKSSVSVRRVLERVARGGASELDKIITSHNAHPEFYSERLYDTPTNCEFALLLASKMIEKLRLMYWNTFFTGQWCLFYQFNDEFSPSLWRYRRIVPPPDRLWADPHVVFRDGRHYVFIEEVEYRRGIGHIAVFSIERNGRYSQPKPILTRDYHLSYPFVFSHENQLYMVPESGSNGTIQLFKCRHFPDDWVWVMNLMEGIKAYDPTLFYYHDKWWMFAAAASVDGGSANDELHLFFSKELMSDEWEPHPLNPVVSDCKAARPAGKLFERDGRLYRPSQNCSVRYGYGFNLSLIEELSETDYRESVVTRVRPNWQRNLIATHTFNEAEGLHMVDGLYRRFGSVRSKSRSAKAE